MEISKEKLLSIIQESYDELDEVGKRGNSLASPILDDSKNHIGWDMRVNPEDENSPRVNVIFTCDIEEFVANHPDLVKKLKEEYGNIKWSSDTCPKYRPHRNQKRGFSPLPGDEDDTDIGRRQYVPTGEKYDLKESLKRIFKPIVKSELGFGSAEGEEFNKALAKRSIPSLNIGNLKYEDNHQDVWSNELIKYRVLGFNLYESAQAFLKSVVARIAGRETEEQSTTYLARQFNTIYSNWEETRKNDKRYEGKTPILNLDARGYSELNLDVSMKTTLEITGEKIGDNSFAWTISMTNKFGRKRPDEYRIKNGKLDPITLKDGGYLDEGKLVKTVTVQLDPEKEYNDQTPILSDVAVSEGLRQVIEDFKSMIESIDPKSALKYANIRRSDVEKVNEQKEKLVDKIVSEIK